MNNVKTIELNITADKNGKFTALNMMQHIKHANIKGITFPRKPLKYTALQDLCYKKMRCARAVAIPTEGTYSSEKKTYLQYKIVLTFIYQKNTPYNNKMVYVG